jgi:hypothetical protein
MELSGLIRCHGIVPVKEVDQSLLKLRDAYPIVEQPELTKKRAVPELCNKLSFPISKTAKIVGDTDSLFQWNDISSQR